MTGPRPFPWPEASVAARGRPSSGPTTRRMSGPALVVALVVTIVGLVALGRGGLAGPTDWSVGGLRTWMARRDPIVVAMVVLRLAALGAGAQVLVAGLLGAVGTVTHLPMVVHAADLVALPGLRGLTRRIAGIGLSATSMMTPVAGHRLAAPEPVVAVRIDPVGPEIARRLPDIGPRSTNEQGATEAIMVRLDPPVPGADPSVPSVATMDRVDGADPRPPGAAEHPDPTGAMPAPAPVARTWPVRRGDHLWSIARSTLAQAWSRTPGEADVDRYWRAVVRANPDVADPDLIFPGQSIRLPEVPQG